MTAVAITLDEAKERIRRLAEERPDFVYTPVQRGEDASLTICVYFGREGEPSCIIGHAFADELRAAGVDFYTHGTVHGLAHQRILALDPAAQSFLGDVQAMQDTGTPWGEAHRQAVEYLATRE